MPTTPRNFSHGSKGFKPIRGDQYVYDHNWRKLRARRLTDEPLCRTCLEHGNITPATQVDHIKPRADGGQDVYENTQSLCGPCHSAKTAEENRMRFRI
ncbi:HNH endonuclease [Sphingobium sp. LMC3-1-1.1]|uniref:HNH endonuclease n=1 Tax=Sphingobium sp. LMC3-1-1.1 TaxID=3135241 RepID=UPI00342B06AB